MNWFIVSDLDGPITGGTLFDRWLIAAANAQGCPCAALPIDRAREVLARAKVEGWFWVGVLEIGGGLGTMVAGLVEWRVDRWADYHLLDVDAQLIADARLWLASWAESRGLAYTVETASVRLQGEPDIDVNVRLVCAEIGDLLRDSADPDLPRADLLVANAFLDLVDVPAILPRLLGLLADDGLGWFTVNFDGETILEREHSDDALFMRVYPSPHFSPAFGFSTEGGTCTATGLITTAG